MMQNTQNKRWKWLTVSGQSKKTSTHTHKRNEVMLVWGLLRLAPTRLPLPLASLVWPDPTGDMRLSFSLGTRLASLDWDRPHELQTSTESFSSQMNPTFTVVSR